MCLRPSLSSCHANVVLCVNVRREIHIVRQLATRYFSAPMSFEDVYEGWKETRESDEKRTPCRGQGKIKGQRATGATRWRSKRRRSEDTPVCMKGLSYLFRRASFARVALTEAHPPRPYIRNCRTYDMISSIICKQTIHGYCRRLWTGETLQDAFTSYYLDCYATIRICDFIDNKKISREK